MKKENRVFFEDEAEAINHGFRPCGNCMKRKKELRFSIPDPGNLS
jgi:methylphosphotriester-DNA--protein-cysteine methyltransferase